MVGTFYLPPYVLSKPKVPSCLNILNHPGGLAHPERRSYTCDSCNAGPESLVGYAGREDSERSIGRSVCVELVRSMLRTSRSCEKESTRPEAKHMKTPILLRVHKLTI